MNRPFLDCTFLVLTVFMAGPAGAEHPGAVFLTVVPDARSAALGGTGVASDRLGGSSYHNPAGLGFASRLDVGWTHASWLPGLFSGMSCDFAAGAGRVRPDLVVGGSVTYLQLGLVPVYDERGDYVGSYRPFDLAGAVSASWRPLPGLAVGSNLKLVYSLRSPDWGFETTPEPGIEHGRQGLVPAADIGVQFRPASWAGLGLALSNIGPRISYAPGEPGSPLPVALRAGLEIRTPWAGPVEMTLRTEVLPDPSVWTDSFTRVRYRQDPDRYLWKSLGLEARVLKFATLRVGYFEDMDGRRGGVVPLDSAWLGHNISLYRYLKNPDYYGPIHHIGLCWGAGLEYKGIAIDVAADDLIYSFATTNLRCQFSYRLP